MNRAPRVAVALALVLLAASCSDSGPNRLGAAEIVLGRGGRTLLSVDSDETVDGWKLRFDVLEPFENHEQTFRTSGLEVADDGSVFIDDLNLWQLDSSGVVHLYDGGFEGSDVEVLPDGRVFGAPRILGSSRLGGPAVVRLNVRHGNYIQVAYGSVPSDVGASRLAAKDDTIYRTLPEHERIVAVDANGTRQSTATDLPALDSCPVEPGLPQPYGIEVSRDGGLVVGDVGCGIVYRTESGGQPEILLAEPTRNRTCDPNMSLSHAPDRLAGTGLAFDGEGRLWIVDPFCNSVEVWVDGVLRQVNAADLPTEVPVDLGFDSDGNLYLLDAGLDAVLRVDSACASRLPGRSCRDD